MRVGTYISGIGHGAFILWLLFGGLFLSSDDTPPIEVTEVSLMSGAEFAALTAPDPSPEAEVNVSVPDTPEIDDTLPDTPAQNSQPARQTPGQTPVQDARETPPDVSEIALLPEADVDDTAPDSPDQPQIDTAAVVPQPRPPSPLDVPRVAPLPAQQPEPDREVAPEVRDEAVPDRNADVVREIETATAPEEATTEIITEATEATETEVETTSGAPAASSVPRLRPQRPEPTPASAPIETAAQVPADSPVETASVNDALLEALGAPESPAVSNAPQGPPLTRGETEALRVAVSACWNVGSLSSEALQTTVVVAVSMTSTGKPETNSIRMVSSSGGGATAAKQAFEAGRRAILRCGAKGFDLPAEKYEQWRDIEMTFNPEKMRIK